MNSRALCAIDSLTPKRKVVAVCNPNATENPLDFKILLHEVGHMIHYLNMDDSLKPFQQFVGEIEISEIIAMVFANLIYEPKFITQYWNFTPGELTGYSRDYDFYNLFSQRFLVFLYVNYYEILNSSEIQNYRDKQLFQSFSSRYEEKFDEYFGFKRPAFDLFKPRDKIFESFIYLRAIIGTSQLSHHLKQTFSSTWWNSLEAGQYLLEKFMKLGYSLSFSDLLKKNSFSPTSFEYLSNEH